MRDSPSPLPELWGRWGRCDRRGPRPSLDPKPDLIGGLGPGEMARGRNKGHTGGQRKAAIALALTAATARALAAGAVGAPFAAVGFAVLHHGRLQIDRAVATLAGTGLGGGGGFHGGFLKSSEHLLIL